MRWVALAVVAALGLGACGQGALPVPTHADAARLAPVWPDASVEQLAKGRRLYLGRCGACHRPFRPEEQTAERWAFEVPEMQQRAHLSAGDADLVLRYLQAFAAR